MSLNNLSLSPQLLADLYQNVLVQSTASNVPVKPQAKTTVNFLGENKKNILVVVDKANAAFLPDDELAFLTRVLKACELSLADVAIVNWNNISEKNGQAIIAELASKEVLLLGVEPSPFGLPDNTHFYVINTVKNVQYVVAPSLREMEKIESVRRKLWAALKKLFCI